MDVLNTCHCFEYTSNVSGEGYCKCVLGFRTTNTNVKENRYVNNVRLCDDVIGQGQANVMNEVCNDSSGDFSNACITVSDFRPMCSISTESLFGALSDDDSKDENDQINSHINTSCVNNFKTVTFMHWNINGLKTKLFDTDFVNFLTSFSFICLVETFVDNFNADFFHGYTTFCQPSKKLSQAGRPSGGVLCLIKNEFLPWVKEIKAKFGFLLLFIIDKKLFDLSKDVLYVCAYIPPEGSNYYSTFGDEGDGITMLENCLFDILIENDLFVLLSGDLNSRIANTASYILKENEIFDLFDKDRTNWSRKSQDVIMNGYGKTMLNMCTALDLCILNGLCYGDQNGRFTYICDSGSSVIDYFLLSAELFISVCDNCTLFVCDRTESNHMPIVLSVTFPSCYMGNSTQDDNSVFVEKYVWDPEKCNLYVNSLLSYDIGMKMKNAVAAIDVDVNAALQMFNDCIKSAADCMKKRVCVDGKRKVSEFFDYECKVYRKNVRKALKIFRRTLSDLDRIHFSKLRREYKQLLIRKKKQYNYKMINILVESINNQRNFWDTVHKILPKKNIVKNNITVDDWFVHFKSLLEKVDVTTGVPDYEDNESGNDLYFNRPISADEVRLALRLLKCKKAAGTDGIAGEFLKYAGEIIVPFFVSFLNALFDKGIYPDTWCESLIVPLYKKGDVNKPDNYRGISLSNISSKIYGIIINRRLQDWVNEHNLTGEFQAGYKKGYSTIDHLFTLLACVQKQFLNNRKLYVAFIDFEKCFDSINRKLLWSVLFNNGIKGKLLCCVKSMYICVKTRVRCAKELSKPIFCSAGVKQGDTCSPILCSLFLNELALDVIKQGRHGISFLNDAFVLFILLLADDATVLSETVIGLQTQLNSLERSATRLGLKVNIDKCSAVVFRKGGYLAARERWFLCGNPLPVVNAYKYLGIYFSTKLSFSAACSELASKAKKALLCIMQRLRTFDNNSLGVFLKLFDSQVLPIMQYGSEIWAFESCVQCCEKVHLFALKKYLNVAMCTPNDFVYKETCRYPIYINFFVNSLRYWLRLIQMSDDRIPKKAYSLLYDLDLKGKRTWVTQIRSCLFQNGFGFVWLQQGVGDVNNFLKVLKQRLVDCRWQNLNEHLHESNRFFIYRGFCGQQPILPMYLNMDLNRHFIYILTKFRFGISELKVHFYRYRLHCHKDLICPLCKVGIEDEIHFLLVCPFYRKLRGKFISPKFHNAPSIFHYNILMASVNVNIVKNVCLFLYSAFKMRERALS